MLALIGALRDEIIDLKKRMDIDETISYNGGCVFRGKYGGNPVLLAQSGMGRERVRGMAEYILEKYRPDALISIGFAGALAAAGPGCIIVCSTIYDGNGTGQKEPYRSDAGLISASLQAVNGRISLRQGKVITVGEPVCTPEARRKLAKAYGADIVEMESAWIARVAAGKVPFLAVRAVSDTVRDSLPPVEYFTDQYGNRRRAKAGLYLVSHPWQLREIFTLYRNSRRARANLTFFIERLLAEVAEK